MLSIITDEEKTAIDCIEVNIVTYMCGGPTGLARAARAAHALGSSKERTEKVITYCPYLPYDERDLRFKLKILH